MLQIAKSVNMVDQLQPAEFPGGEAKQIFSRIIVILATYVTTYPVFPIYTCAEVIFTIYSIELIL